MWNKYYKFHEGFESFQLFVEYICIFLYTITNIIFVQIYYNAPWYVFLKLVSFIFNFLGYVLP
jgi:hypothetical protein